MRAGFKDRKPFAGGTGKGPRPPRGEEGGFRAPRASRSEGGFRKEGPSREGDFARGEGREKREFRPRREGSFGDRGGFRGPPREDRGGFRGPPRDDRGPRFNRGPREDRGPREERAPRREDGFRDDRGPRPVRSSDRPRREGGFRDERGPRPERNREEGEFRGEGSFFERPHVEKGESYYHGKNACLALFKQRPRDLIRVYVKKGLEADFKEMLNYCAAHRLAFHVVGEADLERITETKHHDGICVLAREKRFLNANDFYKEIGGGRTLVLYLDGVGNPHNLGAIMRTASHFGVQYIAGEMEELPRISPSANRTSEGGAESVSLVRVEEPEGFFDRLKKQGFQVYAFDPSEKAISLFDLTLNEKAVFVMGAEVEGLSGLVKASADVHVRIPGTGVVESLNVSVAAALAMAEFSRQQAAPRNVRIVKKRT